MISLRAAAQQALKYIREVDYPPWDDRQLKKDLEVALAEPDACIWYQDGDIESGFYNTSCKRYFNLEECTPEDAGMRWCCYCGKKLVQQLLTEDEDE